MVGGDKCVGGARLQMDGGWTIRRMNGQTGELKKINKGVKLEYKQTERQVDFFSDTPRCLSDKSPQSPCVLPS